MNNATNLSSSSSSAVSPPIVTPARVAAANLGGAHPAAAVFPLMREVDLARLADDIRAQGLREEIVLYQGQILDGRNRLKACRLAGVTPRFVEFDGRGSLLAFVLSRNLHRRHLDETQRSVIAARAKDLFKLDAAERQRAHQFGGGDAKTSGEGANQRKSPVSPVCTNLDTPRGVNAQAAALLNVSPQSVASASRVLTLGDEQLIAALEAGEVAVSDAASIVSLPKSRQCEALAAVRGGQARTLRAAAKAKKRSTLPAAVLASDQTEPRVMRGKVRRACRYFSDDYESMLTYLDMAVEGCGGTNEFLIRARNALTAAQSAMHDCLLRFGGKRAKRD